MDKKRLCIVIGVVVLVIVAVLVVISRAEIMDPAVDLRSEFLSGRKNDQGKRRDGVACLLEFVV